ncbi:extracellular solute-binding protein [Paenibacillus protaetiae]|uniref:Extracellular solute-binding protein n=1 Tax=Paenibacillus protaetiae TaxID=2509456 RepID=A0A4P6EVF1_9BACL|nr:extracellular solute-binding protein [Paenibacillus protaetiae]QAY66974.1 extracellular solute-binding protein [Paenibacillus protaetiae]
MKKVKWYAAPLALIVAGAIALSGCSSSNNGGSGSADSNPPSASPADQASAKPDSSKKNYTVNVFTNRIQPDPNSAVMKEVNEKLGLNLKITAVPDADYDTKLNLFVASGEMPDVYGGYTSSSDALFDTAATITEDEVKQYAPNIYASFVSRAGDQKDHILELYSKNGELKGFNNGNLNNSLPYGVVIRTDILNELGVSMPKTIADWDTLLKKYKEKYPDKYPITVQNGGEGQAMYYFLSAYGVRRDAWIYKDNQLQYAPFMPGMREALVQLNKWYEAGYINPEYYTMYQNTASPVNEFVKGNALFYQYYNTNLQVKPPYDEGSIGAQLLANFPNATLDWVPFPTLGDGSKPIVANAPMFTNITFFSKALEKDRDKLHAIMSAWDKIYSDPEMYKLVKFGQPDKDYTIVNGAIVTKQEFSTNDAKAQEGFGWPFNSQFDPTDEVNKVILAPYVQENRQTLLYDDNGLYSRKNVDYLVTTDKPTVEGPIKSESGENLDVKNQTYLTQWNTMFTSVIVGTKKIEDFDKFIADWKKQIGDELVNNANRLYNK